MLHSPNNHVPILTFLRYRVLITGFHWSALYCICMKSSSFIGIISVPFWYVFSGGNFSRSGIFDSDSLGIFSSSGFLDSIYGRIRGRRSISFLAIDPPHSHFRGVCPFRGTGAICPAHRSATECLYRPEWRRSPRLLRTY